MAKDSSKYYVTKTCTGCCGQLYILGKPLIKNKIYELPDKHALVIRYIRHGLLRKMKDQTVKVDG